MTCYVSRLAAIVINGCCVSECSAVAGCFALDVGRQRVVLYAMALGASDDGDARAGLLCTGFDINFGAFEFGDGSGLLFVVGDDSITLAW